MKSYCRLTFEEREEISRLIEKGECLRAIARLLGRNPSTISREVRKRSSQRRGYRAIRAQKLSIRASRSRRFGKRKLFLNQELQKIVKTKLSLFWSPEQIATYLKKTYEYKEMHLSTESIYSYGTVRDTFSVGALDTLIRKVSRTSI